MTNEERDALLVSWDSARNNSVFWKATEARLRAEIAAKLFGEASLGINTIELGEGYSAILNLKQTRSFVIPKGSEFDNIEQVIETLRDAMSSVGNHGSFVADRLIKRKFEVSETEYKALSLELQAIADNFIETKNSTPTFELKKPKGV